MSDKKNYYLGGLAELVSHPTPSTFSFLEKWFTGRGSIGRAMRLLHLPSRRTSECVFEVQDGELYVNLRNEENTLYKWTIFKYQDQASVHSIPRLTVSFWKILNPLCVYNTIRMIIVQSVWIAYPHTILEHMEKLVSKIPPVVPGADLDMTDKVLRKKVWPTVIAVGMVSEFFNQYLEKESKELFTKINHFISSEVSRDDWFFSSIRDQEKVKKKEMTFEEYILKYGIRADQDYELTGPRWHEIPEKIKERIQRSAPFTNKSEELGIEVSHKIDALIHISIRLQILRSEAKRKTLIHIDHLRQEMLKKTVVPPTSNIKKVPIIKSTGKSDKTLHKGVSVSSGKVIGKVLKVTDSSQEIPKGIIGIFPNASTEFTIQFPKCKGMIFLRGGQTSHGAIVSREFGIPAVIDEDAGKIPDGVELELDGDTGEWKVV